MSETPMQLEELLRDRQFDEGEKRLKKALEIAQREWENVRSSLKLAGDIGEFNKEDFMIGVIEEDVIIREPELSPTKSVSVYSPTFYPMYFVQNLLTMDEKLSKEGYKTIEALYVFVELATKASERLGLTGSFSMCFGAGYGSARTGWIAEKGYPLERELFVKMFFKNRSTTYDWDFYWASVRENLSQIFSKFESWQNDEDLYKKEVKSQAVTKPMLV
ncbi:MAG: hypothetical protein AAF462_07220 [Thermodesulfobacteriota bacterium]